MLNRIISSSSVVMNFILWIWFNCSLKMFLKRNNISMVYFIYVNFRIFGMNYINVNINFSVFRDIFNNWSRSFIDRF